MQTPSPYKTFSLRLCEEFLEEATFLIEQIPAQRNDAALRWLDLEDDEARLEAHLDGLVVCADESVELCRARATADEPAALQAALRVLCRLGRRDDVLAILEAVAEAGRPALDAAGAALAAEAPQVWHEDFAGLVLQCPALAAAVAPALARAGRSAVSRLLALLAGADMRSAAPVLEALGRVGGSAAVEAVEARIVSEDPEVGAAAAVAALRLGGGVERVLSAAKAEHPWLILPAALGCGRAGLGLLRGRLEDEAARGDALLGLGLLGDLSDVRALFDALSDAEHSPTAATALQIVTGAPLLAEVLVPEPVDPDELFDDERERWARSGESPKRADGTPFGTTEMRLSTDPEAWRAWLSENKSRFDSSCRYRYGLPCSPASLLHMLEAERVPSRVRAFACDELKTRYGCNFPLSVTMPVIEQRRLLARLLDWVDEKGAAFVPGDWYFAGKRL